MLNYGFLCLAADSLSAQYSIPFVSIIGLMWLKYNPNKMKHEFSAVADLPEYILNFLYAWHWLCMFCVD